MFAYNYRIAWTLALAFILFGQDTFAQQMWGSGAYAGQWSCPYPTETSRAAVSMSDEESEARERITSLNADMRRQALEKSRAEREVEYLRRKIDRYFDAEVVEFLLDTHIEQNNLCTAYETHTACQDNRTATAGAARASGDASASDLAGGPEAEPPPPPPPPTRDNTIDCTTRVLVPERLQANWTSGRNYCIGSSRSNAGTVRPSICSDESLRPTDAPRYRSYNATQCSRDLAEYRRKRIQLASAADREERLQQEIEDRQYAIADARERAAIEREYRQRGTEADCASGECYSGSRDGGGPRLRRDWTSTAVNVIGGLGLMYFGRQAERAANEYNAQAGYPSTQSYGYPFYQAGMSGVINGLVGPGAYGCAATAGGGGFQYGAGGGWGMGGAANGVYGPFAAQGGAFGYPQGMYGSPWGGGAYMPGFGPYGAVNGPMGGFNVGGQFGYPTNGAMCITYPCNMGGGGQFGMPGMYPQYGLGAQIGVGMPGAYGPQFGMNGQFGMPGAYGPQFGMNGQLGMGMPGMYPQQGFGMNGQLSAQYQMQMLQMQQQMQMQQYQQQQQYYQAQMQYQQQQQQQYYQRQQQAMQIQQQMAQLNMQLQQLQMQSYYGTGYNGGMPGGLSGGLNIGFNIGGGAPSPIGFPGGSMYNPGYPSPGMPGTTYPGTTFPGTTLPGGPGVVPGGGIRGR